MEEEKERKVTEEVVEKLVPNKGIVLRIYPKAKQKTIIFHNIMVSRKTYNWYVNFRLTEHTNWMNFKEANKAMVPEGLSEEETRKFWKPYVNSFFTSSHLSTLFRAEIKKNSEGQYGYLKDCDSNVIDTAYTHFKYAYKRFQKDIKSNIKRVQEKKEKEIARGVLKTYKYPYDYGFPQFQSYRDTKSYTTRIQVHHIDREHHMIKVPKMGWVRYSSNQDIPYFIAPTKELASPTLSYDGKFFYLSFSYYEEQTAINAPQTDVVGIDLGIKNVATLSDGTFIPNIAKDPHLKALLRRKGDLQRELNGVMERSAKFNEVKQTCMHPNDKGELVLDNNEWQRKRWTVESRQTRRITERIHKKEREIANYKKNLMHQQCFDIIAKNPKGLVFENLNVEAMKKIKQWGPILQNTGMAKFKLTLINHAKKHGIPIKQVSRKYPSTQECSNCHSRLPKMKNLGIRTYVCPKCGMTLDRDINAALNLKQQWDNPEVEYI